MGKKCPEETFANNFTLLRLLAALFVLLSHSYGLLGKNNEEFLLSVTNNQISFSHIGLAIFFFLSGFLVTQSLLFSSGIKHFLWKRLLRIYPALITLILLTVFMLGPLFTNNSIKSYFHNAQTWQYLIGGVSLIKLRFHLPGVFNENGVNGSLWSLPIEFRLYLLLTSLYILGSFKRKLFVPFVVVLAICLLVTSSNMLFTIPKWIEVYLLWGTFFFTGGIVYFFKSKIKLSYLLFLLFLLCWLFLKKIPILNTAIEVVVIGYGILLAGYKFPPFKTSFFAHNDYSYSLYIYAYPIQQAAIYIIGASLLSPLLLFFFTILFVFPLCFFSWNFIEKPCLKKKNIYLKN
jgi:peptidoglycan/LPS O-acetylase OafA/YrhL